MPTHLNTVSRCLPVLAVALASAAGIPARANTVGISVNGTCDFGSCPPTVIAIGGTNTQSFDFTAALADGDRFLIKGKFDASDSGSSISAAVLTMPLLVEYLGNATGGPSHADTVNVLTMANFAVTFSTLPGNRGPVTGVFGPGIGAGSLTRLTGLENGAVDANFGSFTAPTKFTAPAIAATFTAVGGQVDLEGGFSNVFAAGSAIGSYIDYNGEAVSPIPLPSSAWLMLPALAGLAASVRRRKSS